MRTIRNNDVNNVVEMFSHLVNKQLKLLLELVFGIRNATELFQLCVKCLLGIEN